MPLQCRHVHASRPLRRIGHRLPHSMVRGASPSPEEVRAARTAAGLSQEQAAQLVHLGSRFHWSKVERGIHAMDPARWELFQIKVGIHPEYQTSRKTR